MKRIAPVGFTKMCLVKWGRSDITKEIEWMVEHIHPFNTSFLHIDHTTIYRWVQSYAPELEKRCRPHLKTTIDSWRVDETYVKVKKVWMYLYRAVDSQGNTLEFLLSATSDAQAATRFFAKASMLPIPWLLG